MKKKLVSVFFVLIASGVLFFNLQFVLNENETGLLTLQSIKEASAENCGQYQSQTYIVMSCYSSYYCSWGGNCSIISTVQGTSCNGSGCLPCSPSISSTVTNDGCKWYSGCSMDYHRCN